MFSPFPFLFSPVAAMAAYASACSQLAQEGNREGLALGKLAQHSGLLVGDLMRHLASPVSSPKQPK